MEVALMTGMDLGKQYGPLPLGAWIVVVGGGLGIAWYTTQRNKGGVVTVEDVSGQAGVGEGGTAWSPVSPTVPVNGAPEATTNEEWGRNAISYLIAQGYDAAVADAAVRKYLEAAELSLQEYAMMRFALMKLGSPPIPLPPPPPPPTITPPPPPPPPPSAPPQATAIRLIVVTPWPTRRSTLGGIAQEFYGNAGQWVRLYDANRKGTTRPDGSPGFISNPNYLRPGDLIYVP